MDRYTKSDAAAAFNRLCEALGKNVAQSYNQVGAWRLDHAACYGGYNVEEIMNEQGGVSQPFGQQRHSAREFCTLVRFALDAIRESKA